MPNSRATELLLRFAAAHERLCPGCTRPLLGLTEAKCPHCYQPIELSLRPADPKLGWWLAILVPSLFGCGMGLLGILAAATSQYMPLNRPESWMLLSFNLNLPIGFVAVYWRRRIMVWPPRRRIFFALLSNILFAGSVTWVVWRFK